MSKDSSLNIEKQGFYGLVVRTTGSFYQVKTLQGDIFTCVVKGRLRTMGLRTTNPIAVGDNVHCIHSVGSEYLLIDQILPRKNYIIRKSVNLSKLYSIIAANLDLACIIVSVCHPKTDTMFIDRLLVTTCAYQIPTLIIVNKIDLIDKQDEAYLKSLQDIYSSIGYPVLLTCSLDIKTLEPLIALLRGKTTLFFGNSGVGKSTLINMICPGANQKTNEISLSHNSGKHTTTFAQLFEFEDIKLIDTPGVKSFGVVDFKAEELAIYFPEFKNLLPKCKYYNCTHTHEPQCAIKQAVEEGKISQQRYTNYLKLLSSDDIEL